MDVRYTGAGAGNSRMLLLFSDVRDDHVIIVIIIILYKAMGRACKGRNGAAYFKISTVYIHIYIDR